MTTLDAGAASPVHVLYVNDDDDFAELTRRKLQSAPASFTVTTVGTAADALARLDESAIDCVVTSYSLPDTTGIDLLERIHDTDHDPPTILFTGRGSERIASEATRAGVSDYLPIHAGQRSFELLARRVRTLAEAARKETVAEEMSDRFRRTLERSTDAVYAVDEDWRIEYMNETMADRIDCDRDAVVGTVLWEEFPSLVGTPLEEQYRTAMETGESVSSEQRLGAPFDYWVDVRAFPDDDGLTVFSQEITDEREQALALERSETILRHIHDVVFVVDDAGVVEFANAAAQRVIGGTQSAPLVGHHLPTIIEDRGSTADATSVSDAIDSTLAELESDGGTAGFYDVNLPIDFDAGNDTRTLDVRFTPFRTAVDRQVLVVGRDITEQSDVRRHLERERDALREIQRVVAETELSVDERLEALLAVGCQALDLEIGIVSHIHGEQYTVKAAHTSGVDIAPGDEFDLATTYCESVVRSDTVCSFSDATADGRETHPAYEELGLQSYVGAPLIVDGDRYGTINFSSPATRVADFDAIEETLVELLAELVSAELSRGRDRAELQRRQFLFERMQETANVGVFEYAPSTGSLEWSDGVRRIHGVDPGYEPSFDDAIDAYHPDDRETIAAAVDRALDEGEPYDLDLRIVRPDGVVRDVRAWGERVDSPQHGARTLRGVIQDITGRKSREREHKALAEEYEALLETSGDAIFLLDVDTTGDEPRFEFARLSPGYEAQTGLETAAVKGKTPREIFGDEQGSEVAANYRRCVDECAPISYREELDVGPDARFWDTGLAPVVVDGEIVRIVGIARNVTDQVERERSLEATNQRLESLIEATPLAVMEIDPDGTVTRWNDEAESMFGWTREEVVGEFNPVVPDSQRDEFEDHRQRVLGGERIRGMELRRQTKSGGDLDVLLSAAPVPGADGETTSLLAVLEDITPQKQLEAKLRALQETARRLTSAQSSAAVGEIAVEVAADVLGYDLTAVWEHDEQSASLVPLAATGATREAFDDIPTLQSGDSLAWDAFESAELHVYDDLEHQSDLVASGTPLESGLFVPLGGFGVLGVGATAGQTFSDTDVDLFRILGSTVAAALARATRETELQRQNERLDQFASVVAHDLRNPLSVATGFLDIVADTGELEYLDRIESAHDRMARLIDDLLTLASGESTVTDAECVDLHAVTTESWGYVDTAEATLCVRDDLRTVSGDGSRLTQLFENVFRNAVEHGGAAVTVTVGQLADREGFYVADDGDGIPEDERGDVLDHGVTSSDAGTGFGLSIVEDIAKAHGWAVVVTAGADGGARFEFETDP
ncbi:MULTISPECIES: PAS domain S-box protein [Halobacterium]|uniref:histidine kinase n=1 Tax=Halobacterium salinarum (strain ATCC 33171 / DSM 3754 / JCM 8978 / NBRC 102687 / NCIMB 764 / 91-R6) TaxID=2597657 RepID=A0A4D6GZL3_HALS9|nr:PAS domain S-box protein [Halobacterium salinarum]MDL0122003.1 PAS domain-containing protein [Halobacterium salinarum]MDL0124215.1 PAS domain-containing protein [Halobacterium salinarum]MDL0127147.1 PAS domain-containing protein [Halobacterium salinarum]MDL0132962.1 PAS domain-containing protein [Halobacterium salinarum]MDL0144260.1 PAS domain-containing protein [Halobacterium salinarum]